jgi:hypothetical protein
MNDSPHDAESLPSWFVRPESVSNLQRTLFAEKLPEVLVTLRVSSDELGRWYQRDWVSFGPDSSRLLEPWDIDEIQFVRDVVRSGFTDAQIDWLFSQLPRPMNFGIDAVSYSFSFGWVKTVPPLDVLEVIDEYLQEWVDDIDVEENLVRLVQLRNRINTLLDSIDTSTDDHTDDELTTP